MMVIRRAKGIVIATMILGNVGDAPGKVAPAKPQAKAKTEKVAKTGERAPVPRDAEDGEKLTLRLFNALAQFAQDKDMKARDKTVFKLGQFAREIGSVDPDVQGALERAKADEITYRAEDTSLEQAFDSWGAAFIGGYMMKRREQYDRIPRRYKLVTNRLGDEKPTIQSFDTFGAAEHTAIRYWTVKTETSEQPITTVEIRQYDLTAGPDEDGNYPELENLRFPMTYEYAACKAEETRKRKDRGPKCFAPKTTSKTLGFGVKCKESRSAFSRG